MFDWHLAVRSIYIETSGGTEIRVRNDVRLERNYPVANMVQHMDTHTLT